jgi:hypothetical protein
LPQREIIHVPLWGITVMFLYCMRRLACPTCGVTVEVVPWSSGKSPLTISYAWFLSEWQSCEACRKSQGSLGLLGTRCSRPWPWQLPGGANAWI